MNSPCKNCPDREVGCHGKCNKYSQFRKERDEIIDRKAKEADVASVIANVCYRVTKKKIWLGHDT